MADNHVSQLLETLSSCPEALQELFKALMPSLIKNLTLLVQKRQELESDEVSNGEGDVYEEEGNNGSEANSGSDVNNHYEANTGNEAINGSETNTGNGAIMAMKPILVTEPITAMKLLILAMKPIIMVKPTMVPGPSNIVHVATKWVTVSTIAQTTFTMVEAFKGMKVATTQSWMPTTPWMPLMSNPYFWCLPSPPPPLPGGLPCL